MGPKKAVKRKAEPELFSDGGSDSPGLADGPPRSKKRPMRNARGASLSRFAEYDEDEGASGSRGFQEWSTWYQNLVRTESQRSKEFLAGFQKKATAQAEQLQLELKNREENLKLHSQQFLEDYEKACSQELLVESEKTFNETSHPFGHGSQLTHKEAMPLFQQSQMLLSRGTLLLKMYKSVEEGLRKQQLDSPRPAWKKDKQDLIELLACGCDHGEKLTESYLAPDPRSPMIQGKGKLSQYEQAASELFEENGKVLGDDTWGVVAAGQVKRFKELAKTLPATI